MSDSVVAICRYPVKGLGGQVLAAARVAPGAGLAFDRRWILAIVDDHSSLYEDGHPWRPWQYCHTLKKTAAMAKLRAAVVEGAGGVELVISAVGGESKRAAVDESGAGDFSSINNWLRGMFDDPRINVQPCSRPVWDEREMPVSIVNDATVAEFADRCRGDGAEVMDLTAQRFRANIVVSANPPWSEHSAQTITVGKTAFKVLTDIPRCAATQVNPQTAQRDAKIPQLLLKYYGHNHLGVYTDAAMAGEITVGDGVR